MAKKFNTFKLNRFSMMDEQTEENVLENQGFSQSISNKLGIGLLSLNS